MQELVQEMVNLYKIEISPELRYIDLTSEVGELGKELLTATRYGKEEFRTTGKTESEIGDILFSLTCIANTLGIDIEQALIGAMEKYTCRFKEKGNITSDPLGNEKDEER